MKRSKLLSPYKQTEKGRKTSFNIRNKSGVYIIYEGKKVVYVGESSNNLYRTMYRHFQSWNDDTQYRAVFNPDKVKVRIILCTATQATKLEAALILKYYPEKNKNRYEGFTTDSSEKKVLEKFENLEDSPILEYTETVPF
jgi:GIY-YIG catalytic domain